MKTMTKEEARQALRSYFPKKGVPFVVELEFTKDLSDDGAEEMAVNLMRSMMNGEEILPGLKVTRAYRQVETVDSLHVSNTSEKIAKIQDSIKKNMKDLYENVRDLEKSCRRLSDD